jgi:lipopolysaccharide export system protein LptC
MSFTHLSLGGFNQQHYTRLVRILRIAFPVTALVVLAVVVIWPHFDPAQAPKRHAEAKPPEMTNSYFSGVDKSNQPYTITADKTVQKNNGTNDIDMVNPLAEITLKSGAWVAIRGNSGEYREDPGLITLVGDVRLYHDLGYEVQSSAAALDLDQGIAWSDKPTFAHGPRGDIWGDGFKLIRDSDKIIFTGKSRMILKQDEEDAGTGTDASTGDTADQGPQAVRR